MNEYKKQYRLSWIGLYGFNNRYGIAITKALANQYNIQSYSDLAAISNQLIFGSEYDFYEREDGYQALCTMYDFHFKSTFDLEIGMKYTALEKQKVNAIIIYQTDGELSDEQFVLLKDDRNFFNNYYAGTIVRDDTLKKYPELVKILMLLNDKINDQEMSFMNAEVSIHHKTEEEVARAFLQRSKLIEVKHE